MAETSKPQDTKQSASTPVAAMAARDNARAVESAARQGTEAVQQGGRAASDALRQGADATADAARRNGEAGAEAWRRAGASASETTRRSAQAVADGQRRIVEDAAHRFEEMSRRITSAAHGTTENMRRFMALPNAAEGGLRDFQEGMTGLFEGMVQTNLRVAQEFFRLSDPAPVVEMQQRFVREYTDALVQNSATLVRAVRRTADETLRPLEEQLGQRGQANGGEAPHRPSAM